MNLNYWVDNEYFSLWGMMLQELEADRFPTQERTYVDISWHKTRRRCIWLWGCDPAEKTWGCTQTAEGTGSRTPRCRWNWCRPAEKAHDPGQPRTAADRQMPEEVSFSHNIRREGVTFRWHFERRSFPSALWTPNGREIGPLIQSHDVNQEKVSHKPLKCLVATQAETAVIELDEPSCELLLQYCNWGGEEVCATVRGW